MTTSPKPGRAQGGQGGNVSAGKVAELKEAAETYVRCGFKFCNADPALLLKLLDVFEAAQALRAAQESMEFGDTRSELVCRLMLDKALSALETE